MTQLSPLQVCRCVFLLALLLAPFTVQATGLPDTGQTACYTDSIEDSVSAFDPASVARDAGAYQRQDCRYGRNPADTAGVLAKTGAGAKGLDYSKIANNGSALAADVALGTAAGDWACTHDNTTGLMWEVKTSSGLRSSAHTYTWYNSNAGSNAGNDGFENGGTCQTAGRCDTEKFVADVNMASLCSFSDWRLPTRRELRTLVLTDGFNPSIDPTYFPNTQASYFWSASSYVPDPAYAWGVGTSGGSAGKKSGSAIVRLVRGGQF